MFYTSMVEVAKQSKIACALRRLRSSGVASGVSLRATMAALLRALLASSAAAPAPTSPRPAAAPSLESAQSLLITEQGNGWFRSVASSRSDANSTAFPMALSFAVRRHTPSPLTPALRVSSWL